MTDLRVINGIPEGLTTYVGRRPVCVEAVRLTDEADWDVIAAWCGGELVHGRDPSDEGYSAIEFTNADGRSDAASDGDWIVKTDAGFQTVFDFVFTWVFERDTEEFRNELSRVVYLGLTGALPWQDDLDHPTGGDVKAIVDALLSGKSSAQLASEATNGQEGGGS